MRLEGYRQSLQTATTIAERYSRLLRDGAASELQMLSAQEKVDQLRGNVRTVEREVAQLQASARANRASRDAALRRDIETILRQLADLKRQITEHQLALAKVTVTAPIDGVVFDLNVSRGNLVERNGVLLKLIPQDQLQAECTSPTTPSVHPGGATNRHLPNVIPGQRLRLPRGQRQRIGSMPSPPMNNGGSSARTPRGCISAVMRSPARPSRWEAAGFPCSPA